ncbi:hypothetical protein [Spirillospora sp. CA-294931]|uniref:hypothetical protein n=1 Tax=Spirillospora sp. CA-294931 TaxID=3240042 RepID=UPI003D9116B6
MDPMTIAIITAMAGKAVEVAGGEAMMTFTRRVRERFRGTPDQQALERAAEDPGNPEHSETLRATIRQAMADDPTLETLWTQARNESTANDDGVVNVFNGTAEKSIQLRDVHGDLTIN